MLIDDAIEVLGIAVAIPYALGVNDGDRTAGADAQAVGLGPLHSTAIGQAEFLESLLQVLPRLERTVFVAALRFALIAAEEDMALQTGKP